MRVKTVARTQTVIEELTGQKPRLRLPKYRHGQAERNALVERIAYLRAELARYEHTLLHKYGEEGEA